MVGPEQVLRSDVGHLSRRSFEDYLELRKVSIHEFPDIKLLIAKVARRDLASFGLGSGVNLNGVSGNGAYRFSVCADLCPNEG